MDENKDKPDLRIIRRFMTEDEKKDGSIAYSGINQIYEPQRLTRNWLGREQWVRIRNSHNLNHQGLCSGADQATKVIEFYAMFGEGPEVVETFTAKLLRAKILLRS